MTPNPYTLSVLVHERLRDDRARAAAARLASGRIGPVRAAAARLLQRWAVRLEGAHLPEPRPLRGA